MARPFRSSPLLWIIATLGVLVLGAGLFVFSGIYNVGAKAGHWPVTAWFLAQAMQRSVALHSRAAPDPPILDRDLARLGAVHYATTCAGCHGAPGAVRQPMIEHMLPVPPLLDIGTLVKWNTDELFWIIRNGIKYTGMPGWSAPQRSDEVWAMVAFLRALPQIDAATYASFTLDHSAPGLSPILASCARCHDDALRPAASSWAPRLGGQRAAYLQRALREYADGSRKSGLMQAAIAGLSDSDFATIARYYESQMPLREDTGAAPGVLGLGARIAVTGIADAGIPPCLSCHGAQASQLVPRLDGQSAVYLANQLRLWQQGERARSPHGQIMSAIARRLTPPQIAAVAGYFAQAGAVGPRN